MRKPSAWSAVVAVLFTFGCRKAPAEEPKIYAVRGLLKDVRPGARQIVVAHEPVPGLMEAMTMEFPVKDAGLLAGLAPGTSVAFRLSVTSTEFVVVGFDAVLSK